jgi:hypothetical protein
MVAKPSATEVNFFQLQFINNEDFMASHHQNLKVLSQIQQRKIHQRIVLHL